MRRHAGRFAHATVRGMLLLGGLVAAWGAYEAIMDVPAYAVDKPRPSLVGSLLDDADALVDGVLSPPPAGPVTVDRAMDEAEARCASASASPATTGTPAAARAEAVSAVRVPPSDRSPAATPLPRVTDRAADTGLARAVGTVVPVTRPVLDAATPAVQGIAGAGTLEPVGAVVRPVAEPIVEALSPIQAPVLEVTRPIIGQPADPVVPPSEPQSGSVEAPRTIPGTGHSARASTVGPTHPHAAPPELHGSASMERWSGGEPEGAPADASRGQGRTGGTPAGGLTPAASGSANSSSSSGAGTPTAADVSPHTWMPDLVAQRCASSRWAAFTERSPQPDTRPA